MAPVGGGVLDTIAGNGATPMKPRHGIEHRRHRNIDAVHLVCDELIGERSWIEYALLQMRDGHSIRTNPYPPSLFPRLFPVVTFNEIAFITLYKCRFSIDLDYWDWSDEIVEAPVECQCDSDHTHRGE